jgi:hypothetical protein
MYSVFKVNKLAIGLALIMGVMASTASANECSTMQFEQSESNGINYATRIRLNNGLLLKSEIQKYDKSISLKAKMYGHIGDEEKRIINGSKVYFLEEGEHNITVELWKMSYFKTRFTTSIYNDPKVRGINIEPEKSSTFKLNVDKNLAYKLNFTVEGGIEITSSRSLCVLKKNELLSAINNTSSSGQNSEILPEKLEQRLRVVMNKLFKSGHDLGVIKSQVSDFFGAAVDDSFKGKRGEIRLLSVLPFSLAHNMGLLSGDIIVGYGDMKFATLGEFLDSLEYNTEIEINVLRNNTLVNLNVAYEAVVSPQVIYGKNDIHMQQKFIGGVELDEGLHFEFSQIMIEISNYYLKNNYKGSLHIARLNSVYDQFGLIGTLNRKSQTEFTINVDEVLPYSAAESIGLQAGDIISAVNDRSMNSRDLNHINRELQNLKLGNLYSITLVRNGNDMMLKDNYQPSKLSAFSLQIDLDAVEKQKTIVAVALAGNVKRRLFIASKARYPTRGVNNDAYGTEAGVKFTQQLDAADDR